MWCLDMDFGYKISINKKASMTMMTSAATFGEVP